MHACAAGRQLRALLPDRIIEHPPVGSGAVKVITVHAEDHLGMIDLGVDGSWEGRRVRPHNSVNVILGANEQCRH